MSGSMRRLLDEPWTLTEDRAAAAARAAETIGRHTIGVQVNGRILGAVDLGEAASWHDR
jgi:hypothetical protein